MKIRIGVDLGGTKIEAAAFSPSGEMIFRRRVTTPQGNYQGTIEAVVGLVRDTVRESGAQNFTVGVGTPGALNPQNLLKNSNSVCLIGKPLQEDLERLIGQSVRLANDANCFALSEAVDGAGYGSAVVFGAILGTGVGGGVVVHQKILTGPNAIAGEWGHNPLPWPEAWEQPAPPCYCGKKGCIETFLSGPGFSRDAGMDRTATEIAQLAERGDEKAETAMRRYEDRLARSLATVINILDPNAIVLGGGLSKIQRLYTNVPRIWGKYIFSHEGRTLLVPARHGDSSGVRGASWLWD